MNSKKWLIIGVSLAAACAAFVVYQKSTSQLWDAIFPARSVRTTDTRLVDITLTDPVMKQPLHLRIPKAYLVKDENWEGGEQKNLSIQTRLPDMQPVPASPELQGTPGTDEYETSLKAFNNGVHITVSREYSDPAGAKEAHERIREQLYNVNRAIGASEKYERIDVTNPGLEKFRIYACTFQSSGQQEARGAQDAQDETCIDTYREEYISTDLEKPTVHILCNLWNREMIGYRLGCQVYTGHQAHSLSYIFRYSEMSRWQEFDAAVRRLLDGFVVGAATKISKLSMSTQIFRASIDE